MITQASDKGPIQSKQTRTSHTQTITGNYWNPAEAIYQHALTDSPQNPTAFGEQQKNRLPQVL